MSADRVLAVPRHRASPDGRRRSSCAAVVEREFGGCDILINNAGTGSNETILEAPDDKWQFYWDLHVMAAVRLARALAPGMRAPRRRRHPQQRVDLRAQPLGYEPIYNVTKAALVMFSKYLANELIGDHIRVNAINPGLVLTGRLGEDRDRAHQGHRRGAGSSTSRRSPPRNAPIGRFASPEEVASLFVFLCSDARQLQRGLDLLCRRRHAQGRRLSAWPVLAVEMVPVG